MHNFIFTYNDKGQNHQYFVRYCEGAEIESVLNY